MHLISIKNELMKNLVDLTLCISDKIIKFHRDSIINSFRFPIVKPKTARLLSLLYYQLTL